MNATTRSQTARGSNAHHKPDNTRMDAAAGDIGMYRSGSKYSMRMLIATPMQELAMAITISDERESRAAIDLTRTSSGTAPADASGGD